jgi:putative intracellular protease/amidase
VKKTVLLILFLLAAVVLPGRVFAESKQILMVITSANQIREGKPTGLWLEEFAIPYLAFKEAGLEVTVVSIKGGEAPIDPRSMEDKAKVRQWSKVISILKATAPLAKVDSTKYDAIFLPGGHGAMFDLPADNNLKGLLDQFAKANKVIAAVCHGPAGFVGAKKADGSPLVAGLTVTAFTDAEEKALHLDKEMPFLLETRLREERANFIEGEKWGAHVEVDGRMVTGQNPASSEGVARAVIKLLM